jgi:initiation factor 1A
MPPKQGGKKTKRTKKTGLEDDNSIDKIPLCDYEDGQSYAIATKMMGNLHFMAKCSIDKQERMITIPGKFARFKGRNNRVIVGSVILINLRDYQDSKGDLIYIYSPIQGKYLLEVGELNDIVDKNNNDISFGLEETEDETANPIDLDQL